MSAALRAETPLAQQIGLWTRGAASAHAAEIARLVPLARELARSAGPAGVTVADLRAEGERRGLVPAYTVGRELSYLGTVMRAAGLRATDRTRRSSIPQSHGNRHTVHVLPELWRAG